MNRRGLAFASLLALVTEPAPGTAPSARAAAPARVPEGGRPRLILLVAVDQFRYDYLTRFRGDYTGGLDRLLKQGAVFTNAHLEHYPSVTAIGHATMLSGAPPSVSGIVGNDWYDRALKKNVTSVEDLAVQGLGGNSASSHRLLVSTLGDELKLAGRSSKVIGLSLKDRSAILPGGRMADGAFFITARIFLQNAINLGLDLVTAPDVEASEGDDLEVAAGKVINKTTGKTFAVVPLPKARQAIIDAGGLVACTRKRVIEAAAKA